MRNIVSMGNGGRPNFRYGRIAAFRVFPLDVGNQPVADTRPNFSDYRLWPGV